jgi:hypothetical protein
MSETETTEAFLKRIAKWIARNVTPDGDLRAAVLMSPTDADLLLSLARRGAAIPDEPTEAMVDVGYAARTHTWPQDVTIIYRAMLSRALKEFSK